MLQGGPTTPGQVQLNPGDIIDTSGVYYILLDQTQMVVQTKVHLMRILLMNIF